MEILYVLAPLAVTIAGALVACELCTRPVRRVVGSSPTALAAQDVTVVGEDGARLRSWFSPGRLGSGAVLLLHQYRADRRAMIGRAIGLARHGFATLSMDLRAHGESDGDRITFGARKGADVRAAVARLRELAPGERIGAVGYSLGGVTLLAATEPCAVDAIVLEAVYPTLRAAIANRLALVLGPLGRLLARPIERWLRLSGRAAGTEPNVSVQRLTVPALFIAGERDNRTSAAETLALAARCMSTADVWIVPGAGHQDLHAFSPSEYEARVVAFFTCLRRDLTRASQLAVVATPEEQ